MHIICNTFCHTLVIQSSTYIIIMYFISMNKYIALPLLHYINKLKYFFRLSRISIIDLDGLCYIFFTCEGNFGYAKSRCESWPQTTSSKRFRRRFSENMLTTFPHIHWTCLHTNTAKTRRCCVIRNFLIPIIFWCFCCTLDAPRGFDCVFNATWCFNAYKGCYSY